VLEETGKRDEADAIYRKIIEGFNSGLTRAPSDLIYVAQSFWATEYFHDANDVFKAATQANPQHAEAFVGGETCCSTNTINPRRSSRIRMR
jgi:hypothetical protein